MIVLLKCLLSSTTAHPDWTGLTLPLGCARSLRIALLGSVTELEVAIACIARPTARGDLTNDLPGASPCELGWYWLFLHSGINLGLTVKMLAQ